MGKVVPRYDFDALFQTMDALISGNMYIDKELLHREALKHDIHHRIDEFENILSDK